MFNGFFITNTGQKYITKAMEGKTLVLTRGQYGDGPLPANMSALTMTALISPLADMPISKRSSLENCVITTTQFSNHVDGEILPPFYFMEAGIFGKVLNADGTEDEDAPEALLMYTNAQTTDKADYIPGVLTEFIINWPLTISETENVTVEIGRSLVYPTMDEFNARAPFKATAGGTDEDLTVTMADVALEDGLQLLLTLPYGLGEYAVINYNGAEAPIKNADGTFTVAEQQEEGTAVNVIYNEAEECWYILGGGSGLEELASHKNNTKNPHGVTKAQVGLGNVDNTADKDKSVKSAGSAEKDASGNVITKTYATVVNLTEHTNSKDNPHGVTKAQVGLGNADNTADKDKPVSTAQENAIKARDITGTASGNPACATDSAEAPFEELAIYGESKQEQTTGKNKFGFGKSAIDVTAELRGLADQRLTFTKIDDNSIKCNYTGGTYGTGFVELNGVDGTKDYAISFVNKENSLGYTPRIEKYASHCTENKLVLSIYSGCGNNEISSDNYFILENIQVEEGTTSTPYEPYTGGKAAPNPDYPQEIESALVSKVDVIGPNQLPNELKSQTIGGLTIDSTAERIKITGTTTKTVTVSVCETKIKSTKGLFIKGATKLEGLSYIARIHNDSTGAMQYWGIGTQGGYIAAGWTIERVYIQQNNGGVTVDAEIQPQIVVGNADLPFEPYQKQTVFLTNFYAMNGLNGVRDCIDAVRGVFRERFEVVVLDGSDDEGWYTMDTNTAGVKRIYTRTFKVKNSTSIYVPAGNILCSHYKPISASDTYLRKQGIATTTADNYIYFYDENFNTADISLWKAHLKANPITLMYERETPKETALPAADVQALKALHTYSPSTTVNANAPVEMKYFKNTENGSSAGEMKTTIEKLAQYAIDSLGQPIGMYKDLNDYIEEGVFYSAGSNVSTTIGNAPYTTCGFRLMVVPTIEGKGYKKQIAIPSGRNSIAIRSYYNNEFAPWLYLENVGDITQLLTTDKTGVVAAINELVNNTHSLSGGTAIPMNADMLEYKTVGNYSCALNKTAETLQNSPTNQAFMLKVGRAAGTNYPCQEYTIYNTGARYYRWFNTETNEWSAFRIFAATGALSSLKTSAKDNLVDALNEVNGCTINSLGTDIPEGTDLDNLKNIGVYRSPNASRSQTLGNSPYTGCGFRLEVSPTISSSGGTYMRQTVHPSATDEIAIRTLLTNGWTDWTYIREPFKKTEITKVTELETERVSGESGTWKAYEFTASIDGFYLVTGEIGINYPTSVFQNPVMAIFEIGDRKVRQPSFTSHEDHEGLEYYNYIIPLNLSIYLTKGTKVTLNVKYKGTDENVALEMSLLELVISKTYKYI